MGGVTKTRSQPPTQPLEPSIHCFEPAVHGLAGVVPMLPKFKQLNSSQLWVEGRALRAKGRKLAC